MINSQNTRETGIMTLIYGTHKNLLVNTIDYRGSSLFNAISLQLKKIFSTM